MILNLKRLNRKRKGYSAVNELFPDGMVVNRKNLLLLFQHGYDGLDLAERCLNKTDCDNYKNQLSPSLHHSFTLINADREAYSEKAMVNLFLEMFEEAALPVV